MTSAPVRVGADGVEFAPMKRAPGTSRWQKAVGALGLVVILWMGSQMYDVIFFDGTFPGAGPGAGQVDPQPGQEAPAPGGAHTPSRGNH